MNTCKVKRVKESEISVGLFVNEIQLIHNGDDINIYIRANNNSVLFINDIKNEEIYKIHGTSFNELFGLTLKYKDDIRELVSLLHL